MFKSRHNIQLVFSSSEKWREKKKEKRMCVEDRKAMRADQERRAEIIKVLKIRQHFNDFYMRIVNNVAFFLTQIKSSETIVIFKSKGGTILQSKY